MSDLIVAEFPQIRRVHSAHAGIGAKIQGVSARIHHTLVDILVDYVVADPDNLILFHKNNPL
ncbi:hypothetical protein D1872_348430 [compost metagenome]